MSEALRKPEELLKIDFRPPHKPWMDTPVKFEPGTWSYPAAAKNIKALGLPNPREWSPSDEDWKLPANWKEIVVQGIKERLGKYRSFRIFLDICVRCGACADKCHFYLGSGDPKNMPVLRAELLRSIYRGNFTAAGVVRWGMSVVFPKNSNNFIARRNENLDSGPDSHSLDSPK